MESNHIAYNFDKSLTRIDEILNTSDNSYEEVNSIPSRDRLTYTNGFYTNCTALFADICNSSSLPKKYKRPTLAKIYRGFISEVIAIINGNSKCSEINVQGDCVWAVFDTPKKRDIDEVFSTAARISSIVDTLNCKFRKKGIDEIKIGIGMDYGRALMIKAGYNGSGINEVVWMGDVVNSACHLCGYGNQSFFDLELMVSDTIYSNLNDENKELLSWNSSRNCYHGRVVNVSMNEWVEKNK
jgi:class 3 adenylate cyclase